MDEKEKFQQGDSFSDSLDGSGSNKETGSTTDKDNTLGDVHTTVGSADSIGYTEYFDYMINLGIVIIFFLGIIAGLISSRIMWGRIKHI